MDTNRQGHATRVEVYAAVDDMTAVLQMPKSWIHDELRNGLHRMAAHIGHSRNTAVRSFDIIDTDLDGALIRTLKEAPQTALKVGQRKLDSC